MSAEAVTQLLYEQSGLLGISGVSGDMQVLLASDDPHAAEAVAVFAYRAACEVAALAASLSGLDCLVFTAGIGEHSAAARAAICARLGWIGVETRSGCQRAPCERDRQARQPRLGQGDPDR